MHPPNNLPLQLTSFIGREREIADVKRLLGTSRLLTLTGAGGSGKTRLALQAASQVVDEYPDGVYFVNLAPITDPDLVVSTIAQALDVKEVSGQPLIETLKAYLKGKEVLLLLDNFEQVLGAASVVLDLLLSATYLKVMVTSRESLHLQGEQLYPVLPLELPDLMQQASIEELSQNEAVALFRERARSVKPDFDLTEENAPVVAQICSRLDGLPLAIELAAARIQVLTPQAMLSRLESRLNLLTGGAYDRPARHQTLRNTIGWSYDLLSDGEKQLFRRMAVFQGGRTLEALEAVCSYDEQLQMDMLDRVQSLVSKSLLQRQQSRNADPRFWMLETIHEYARVKLQESGEAAELGRQHALYFMRLAEEAEPHLTGKEQQEWLDRLQDEHDNLRASLRWASEQASAGNQEAAEVGLRTVGAIWRFWVMTGLFTQGNEQIRSTLAMPEKVLQACLPGYKATVLNGAGILAYSEGDFPAARSFSEEAILLGREANDMQRVAFSLNNLAMVAHAQGDLPQARALYEESLELRRKLDDKRGIAICLGNLGNLLAGQGDYPAARAWFEESAALYQELGDKWGAAISLNSLGSAAIQQEDYLTARALFERSLELSRELGDMPGAATSLGNLGHVAVEQGDYPAAWAWFEESLGLMREIGDRVWIPYSLGSLGLVAAKKGDYQKASALLAESLTLHQELEDKLGIAYSMVKFGVVAIVIGQTEKGVRLLGAAAALMQSMTRAAAYHGLQVLYDESMQQARLMLGDGVFEKAWQEGQTMSMEQAIAFALELMPGIQPSARTQPEPATAAKPGQEYPNELSRREVEVLRLLAEGLPNDQIAERLFLSANTVRAHLYSVYSKLDVSNRGAAIRFATDHGLT